MAERIALSLVTGFLGAGKTTLINRLLKDPALTDTAVIVNEFGAVGIDHLLVEKAADDGVIALSDGCLCCTVRGALIDRLADLAERVDDGRAGRLRRVVVETTGLADPVPLLQALAAHETLAARFSLDGVVTVIDAIHGRATLDAHEEARRQAALADRLVVTKAEDAPAGERERLAARLRALAPNASQIDAAAVRPSALLDCGGSMALAGATGEDGHHHDHDHDHDHDHGHSSAFESVELVHEKPVPTALIDNFLDLLRSQCGERILRIKGIAETRETPEWPLVVHGVRTLLHPPQRLAAWPPGPRGTRLVVIGQGLDGAYVRRLFAGFTGMPGIDTPDRAALEDNPLAISGFRR